MTKFSNRVLDFISKEKYNSTTTDTAFRIDRRHRENLGYLLRMTCQSSIKLSRVGFTMQPITFKAVPGSPDPIPSSHETI